MDRKLINYLPYVVRDYAEFQGITGAEQPEFENAWAAVDDLLNNQFIKTAGNLGLSRWEKILGITPKGTDTLDDRRFRVLTRLNEELPYTLPQLRVILESLCGAGNYSADVADYTLLVKGGRAFIVGVNGFFNRFCGVRTGIGKLFRLHLTIFPKIRFSGQGIIMGF